MVVSGTAELEEFWDQRQEAEGMSWEWVARVCVCVCARLQDEELCATSAPKL